MRISCFDFICVSPRSSAPILGFALGLFLVAQFAFPESSWAAESSATRPLAISWGAAALIGLCYYLAQSAWLAGLGFWTLYRPLVAGALVGLILGDPAGGARVGAEINLAYVGFIAVGGALPSDIALAGYVGAALALDELACQLIADNIHIHPAVLKLAARAKGAEGVLLVTDAMAGAGMPDGDYMLGGLAGTVRQGVARVADGALAGSTLTLERGWANFMAATGGTLAQALPAATRAPARVLGLGARKGDIAPGYDADLVALDPAGQVALTVVGGAAVVRR